MWQEARESYIMRGFITYISGNIRVNESGGGVRYHSKDTGENNITMDLRGIGWEGVDWNHLGLDRYY
jgi:hypothetical protein